jgi:hypothetical protein
MLSSGLPPQPRAVPSGVRGKLGARARGLYYYYVCSTRYRYGTDHCPGDRLPKDALEEAIIDQMQEVYGDSSLIEPALAEDAARRMTGTRQELAGWIATSPRSRRGRSPLLIARSGSIS